MDTENTGGKKNILLVEDETLIALSLSETLSDAGYTVKTVTSGTDALTLIKSDNEIDFVLMDIDLGRGLNGPKTAELILKEREIPILFLSSHTEPEIVEKTESIGSYGYVVKHSGKAVLLASVRMALQLFESRRRERQAEAALRSSEEKLRRAERIAHIGYYEIDVLTGEAKWSEETFRIFGLAPASGEPTVETYRELVHEDDRDAVYGMFHRCFTESKNFDLVYRIKKLSGGCRHVHSIGQFRYNEEKEPVAMFGTIQDVTEQIEVEEKLRENREELIEADKMASLGVLTAGMAHEINNPNQIISTSANILNNICRDVLPFLDRHYEEEGNFLLAGMQYSELRGEMKEYLTRILKSSARISKIVKELKSYARKEPYDMDRTIDINDVLTSAVSLIGSYIDHHTRRFSIRLSDAKPKVRGSFQKLEQVFVNVLQNACQALETPQQGIRIATGFDFGENRVEAVIEDEGAGMTPEILSQIQNPFFTTRRQDGGTGLGLSISANIINDHRGRIDFFSRPGEGTKVVISLPAAEN